ncbi:MAG: hypothetical protein IH628_03905, partial [Proteobacteria bacterium]|nr:hypothetical protein [Pseudomonadota bacterium]
GYLADRLFAKAITCEDKLNRTAGNIFIGSMSVGSALKNPLFLEEHKVVVTSGDRHDMIAASLASKAAALILTNGILPPSNIIEKAAKLEIPLLLVSADTYEIARQIEGMESLPTKDDTEKIAMVARMVRKHVDIETHFPSSGAQ